MTETAILLATGATTTAFNWSSIDLSPITDTLNSVAPVAMPIVITVSAFFIGVTIVKKLIKKAQG